ncbi:MAG TPA: aldo/keto reductase [Actinomycetaceae bacterium]|nr:aldo/keto reductase [Actinomycetaceae bacterium]
MTPRPAGFERSNHSARPVPAVELASGDAIPQLGLGTYKIAPEDAEHAVSTALDLGIRHIDAAAMYRNEREVGAAIRASGVPRNNLWITSKLDNPYHSPADARAAFARSLDDLGLDFVDLYLIHWPLARTTNLVATWETLLEFTADGRARNIGVSNFQPAHLERIITATGATPTVNQVEVNPYLTQEPLRALHRTLGIVTEAWSPLARGRTLRDPVIKSIASRLNRTPSQVTIRWHLQRGDVVFPKSSRPERIAENLDVLDFVLDDDAMDAISALNRDERSGSNPDHVELEGGRQ